MNNVYNNQPGLYTIRGDMCYENKTMANTALSERREQQTVSLTVGDHDRKSKPRRLRPRLRLPAVLNASIIIVVAVLLCMLEWGPIPQKKQGFYCKDPTISFLFKGDTISLASVLIGSLVGPLVMIAAVEALKEGSFGSVCMGIVWQWYRELLIGLNVVLVLVESAKVFVGEHRPHFLTSCLPDTNYDCTPGTFVQDFRCTNTQFSDYFLRDSSRSFPSGHAAISVFVSLYTAWVVQWRLPTDKTGSLFKPFLISVCLMWALVCSLSRVTDRRHHWWDVLAGSILGVACAFYALMVLCKKVKVVKTSLPRASQSTTTLLDVKNKDATSVII